MFYLGKYENGTPYFLSEKEGSEIMWCKGYEHAMKWPQFAPVYKFLEHSLHNRNDVFIIWVVEKKIEDE